MDSVRSKVCPFVSPSCGPSPGLKGVCLVAVLSDFRRFYEIVFFWKDRPQTEGSRHIDPGIKTPPVAHTRGTPIGAHGRSYTPVAHRSTPPGTPRRRAAAPPPPPTTPETPPRGHFVATRAYPEVPWDPFSRPTCVGHVQGGLGALAGSHWARGSHFSQK